MEDLAMLVAGMLLVMLVSSLASLITGWRSRTRRMRIIAVIVGIPGAFLGAMFMGSSNTITGAVIGLMGASGLATSAYWLWRSPGELHQD